MMKLMTDVIVCWHSAQSGFQDRNFVSLTVFVLFTRISSLLTYTKKKNRSLSAVFVFTYTTFYFNLSNRFGDNTCG